MTRLPDYDDYNYDYDHDYDYDYDCERSGPVIFEQREAVSASLFVYAPQHSWTEIPFVAPVGASSPPHVAPPRVLPVGVPPGGALQFEVHGATQEGQQSTLVGNRFERCVST